MVDPSELTVLLAGHDPATGEPLISSRGSTIRAKRRRSTSRDGGAAQLGVTEAAALLGAPPTFGGFFVGRWSAAAPSRASTSRATAPG